MEICIAEGTGNRKLSGYMYPLTKGIWNLLVSIFVFDCIHDPPHPKQNCNLDLFCVDLVPSDCIQINFLSPCNCAEKRHHARILVTHIPLSDLMIYLVAVTVRLQLSIR